MILSNGFMHPHKRAVLSVDGTQLSITKGPINSGDFPKVRNSYRTRRRKDRSGGPQVLLEYLEGAFH